MIGRIFLTIECFAKALDKKHSGHCIHIYPSIAILIPSLWFQDLVPPEKDAETVRFVTNSRIRFDEDRFISAVSYQCILKLCEYDWCSLGLSYSFMVN